VLLVDLPLQVGVVWLLEVGEDLGHELPLVNLWVFFKHLLYKALVEVLRVHRRRFGLELILDDDLHLRFLGRVCRPGLLEDAFCNGTYLARRECDLDVANLPDHGLVLALLDAWQWPYYVDHVVLLRVLFNGLVARVVVLLVAQQDVVKQRALRWKETTSDLDRLGMPVLALKFTLPFDGRGEVLLSALQDEPHLG